MRCSYSPVMTGSVSLIGPNAFAGALKFTGRRASGCVVTSVSAERVAVDQSRLMDNVLLVQPGDDQQPFADRSQCISATLLSSRAKECVGPYPFSVVKQSIVFDTIATLH